jgi:hypothetical protein
MATTVVDIIKVKVDGKDIECKPLKIKNLRKFMTEINKLQDITDDEFASLDVLIACCGIALEQYTGEEQDAEALEDSLDMPTIYRIIEGASGIVLDEDASNPA